MPKRILVINDTQEILELLRALLEDESYEVVLSSVPMQKLTDVERVQPDLILLDILFREEKTGWQMLQMLRSKRSTASIPVIICSAAIKDVQEQEGYLNSQGIRIVYKPFDIEVLLDTVKAMLETVTASNFIIEKGKQQSIRNEN